MNKKMGIGVILVKLFLVASVLLVGCAQPQVAEAKGTLQVLVTDAPPTKDITSIMVTVESVSVHKAAAGESTEQPTTTATDTATATVTATATPTSTATPTETGEETSWLPLNILAGKATFDLLKIKGIEEVLAVSEMEAGKYTQIRMVVSKVQVSISSGPLQDAILPSGILKFTHSFDIISGETTALLFDFDAEKSITITGKEEIIVKPVIKLSKTNAKPTKSATPTVTESTTPTTTSTSA